MLLKNSIAFHSGSNCKNNEKYETFKVPIEKEITRIDKNGEKIAKNISYITQFIDDERFMAVSLSYHFNILSEGINKIKCKYENEDEKCQTFEITYEIWDCFLQCTNPKDDLIKYKCLCYNTNHQQKFDEK